MKLTRRYFLKNSSLALGGSLMLPNYFTGSNGASKHLLGVQLYSVRDDMKKNALKTLQQVAAIGYKHVEHANYLNRKFYGYSAVDFKKLIDDLGLKMPSGHTVLTELHWDKSTQDFTDTWKTTVEDAATVGQRYVISPWMAEPLRTNYNELLAFTEVMNKCGELCKKSGMMFGYHNHDFEFNTRLNGKLMYDIILDNTDPLLVMQQIDIGNMYGAGGKALDILKKYPGRFASMHVKDEIQIKGKGEMDGDYESTVLGRGVLPVKKIVDAFKKSGGTTDFIVEQESYQQYTALEAISKDFAIMKGWKY